MRHRIYGKHLSRNKDERLRLFKGLISQLILHGTIQTSQTKAKAIKGLVDKVINLAKVKRTQPQLQSILVDKNLRERLIKEIIPKLGNKTSGYTSLVKMGTRLGDQTMMVKMSLIGAERLPVLSSQLSEKDRSVISKSVTGKQITERPKSENRKQKTDNRTTKKSTRRSSRK